MFWAAPPLIRDLLKDNPSLAQKRVGGTTFLEAVLKPHRCYHRTLKGLFPLRVLSGLAHITGGGVKENLNRILPADVDARVDLSRYRPHDVFGCIREASKLSDGEMLRTFNLGVGMVLACSSEHEQHVLTHVRREGKVDAYVIGEVVPGCGRVDCVGAVPFGI